MFEDMSGFNLLQGAYPLFPFDEIQKEGQVGSISGKGVAGESLFDLEEIKVTLQQLIHFEEGQQAAPPLEIGRILR